ncbi:unnamed protein product [Hermetia illucens]|uniref:Uncharacterized protein n=1 Tax=Hermetia illucens TaxID=343691 RepID=A0A7R8Z0W3_HERIL|nr:unnamed protein product [Hermetia illucens]
MVPYKRPAAEKSGIPVYQPGATTYQQLMQLQQPFVPVSSVVSSITAPTVSTVEQLSVKNESIATYKPASVEITAAVTTQQQTHTLTHAQSYTTNHAYTNHQITHPQIHSQTHQQPLLQTPPMTPQSSLTSLQHHNTTPVHHNPVTSQTHLHGSLFSHTPTHHPISTAFTVPPTSTISYSTHFPIVTPHHPATYYPDPATIAKEVAQKNYANALKMAAASNALSGKPLTALSYTGVALNKGVLTHNQAATHAAMQAANHQTVVNPHQVALTTGHRLATQVTSAHSVNSTPHYASHYSVARPPATYVQAQPVLRPQLPHALTAASAAAAAATNPFAAAAANQQFMSHQQNLFYPGLMASYPFGMTQSGFAGHAAMHSAAAATGGLTAAMPPVAGVPQVAAAPAPGSAVVLNPYKKMKTS